MSRSENNKDQIPPWKILVKEWIDEIVGIGILFLAWIMFAILPFSLWIHGDLKDVSNGLFTMLYLQYMITLGIFLINLFSIMVSPFIMDIGECDSDGR